MGRAFADITDQMRRFIAQQQMFFVATAPSGDAGRVNLSPKGLDSFRLLPDNRAAFLDLTGSGAETIAHVQQNGRITFMFCSFDGKPDIVRLYGSATAHFPHESGWPELRELFDGSSAADDGAVRSIIVAQIDRTSNSCGYGIPLMDYVEQRTRLIEWADDKSDADLATYWATKNAKSIDGLPAVRSQR